MRLSCQLLDEALADPARAKFLVKPKIEALRGSGGVTAFSQIQN